MEAEQMNRNFSAFYMDPPIFVGEDPVYRATSQVDFAGFDKEMLRISLDCGIALKVTVEGLFVFDFTNYPPAAVKPEANETGLRPFDEAVDIQVRRTYVMNAYLAFFHTRQLAENRVMLDRMVVTPELIIAMGSFAANAGQSFASQRTSHLVLSRFPSSYATNFPPQFDSRINMRGGPVAVQIVRAAAEDLSRLMVEHQDSGLILADLFMRATKAFQDHNYSLSLIHSWAITERLINILWQTMQEDNKNRGGKIFIGKNRKSRLNDGRTFTAAVMSEMLSFLNYLSSDIYDDMNVVRKARNGWMHSLDPVSASSAELSIKVCERLLAQVMSTTLNGATGRRIHG